MTRWTIHSEEYVYQSPWVGLSIAEVEKPSGERHPHHIVRVPQQGSGAVVVKNQSILLIHRHRYIPDQRGWELPAGRIDPGETPIQAAEREVHEETGWTVRNSRPLCQVLTSPGLCDQRSHVILADGYRYTGPPSDTDEADDIRWWTPDDVKGLLRAGEVIDAFTISGLLWYLHLIA